ncbi:ribonuclease 3 [Gigaspora margarita]|uniref:Ribonuclease 3 n=1 Tax=Gigaspora margarita TaxID=4874 RepID=A0A8H3WYE4_GIGMA|nr:ribonuclease 3 [Gigaspora margarita]
MEQELISLLSLSQPQRAIFLSPFPRIDFPPLPHLTPETAEFAFAYHNNIFQWNIMRICGNSTISFCITKITKSLFNRSDHYQEILKIIMLSDKVLACYAIYLGIYIDNRMCDHLIDCDHANSFKVWVYGYQQSFGSLVCEQFVESLMQPLINSLYGLDLKNNKDIVDLINYYFKVLS